MDILVRSLQHEALKGVEVHLLEVTIGKRTGYRSTFVSEGLHPADLFLERVANVRTCYRDSEKTANALRRDFAFSGTTRSEAKAYKDFDKMVEIAKDSKIEFIKS